MSLTDQGFTLGGMQIYIYFVKRQLLDSEYVLMNSTVGIESYIYSNKKNLETNEQFFSFYLQNWCTIHTFNVCQSIKNMPCYLAWRWLQLNLQIYH